MPFEIIKPGTHIDFLGKRKLAGMVSLGILLASLLAIPLRGVQLGIDFAGGTEVQVRFPAGAAVTDGDLRAVAGSVEGINDPSVVRFGTDSDLLEYLIKFRGVGLETVIVEETEVVAVEVVEGEDVPAVVVAAEEVVEETPAALDVAAPDVVDRLTAAIREQAGPHTVQRVEFVGPRVGAELREDGMMALLFASLAILAYLSFRFSSRFAPGAIVAVIHDLSITAGIFVILGMEFDLRILAAMLAIMGYSLNDTIIIYDRIRENMELRTAVDLPEVLNESVNQTLSRTILTSFTTLLAVLSLFFLGGEVIRPFAFAMAIGVLVGTYSSIYIAAPTLLILESRFGKTQAA